MKQIYGMSGFKTIKAPQKKRRNFFLPNFLAFDFHKKEDLFIVEFFMHMVKEKAKQIGVFFSSSFSNSFA